MEYASREFEPTKRILMRKKTTAKGPGKKSKRGLGKVKKLFSMKTLRANPNFSRF
jgi:hypothetical protein